MMQAMCVEETGTSSVLQMQQILIPSAKSGEVLVRQSFAGVNFIDVYMRRGDPYLPISLPLIPGMEGSGTVEQIPQGTDTKLEVGDRIAYIIPTGTYAEYVTVPEHMCILLPKKMSLEEGASLFLQGMTAYYLVHDLYAVQPGDYVLVHAAAGGVGLQAIQQFKQIGARVIGTVSDRKKAKIAQQHIGMEAVIIYTETHFPTEVLRLTNGIGADYIIDGVGKQTFTQNLEAIKTRGSICIYGSASGVAEAFVPNVLQEKSLTLYGGNLMHHIASQEELLRRASELIEGWKEGWLQIFIHHTFPLKEAAKAHQLLENRRTTGKILLQTY